MLMIAMLLWIVIDIITLFAFNPMLGYICAIKLFYSILFYSIPSRLKKCSGPESENYLLRYYVVPLHLSEKTSATKGK